MPFTRWTTACLVLGPALLVALAMPAGAQSDGCAASTIFTTQVLSSIPPQRHAEAADLNGDGVLDLVVSTGSTLVIELGSPGPGGTVTFAPIATYTGYGDATGCAIADFDGDGIKDIALTSDVGGLYLLKGAGSGGHGTGAFTQYATFSTIGSCWDVAAADINGDGITDLVVGARNGTIQPLIGIGANGVGNGQFSLGTAAATSGSVKGIAVADLDLDGALDVVASGENSKVSVLRGVKTGGVPDGTFELVNTLEMTGVTFDVTVADFNQDGRPDIASANYGGQSISVALAQGAAFNFASALIHAAPGFPLGIASADFNRDGYPDLVVAATNNGTASFAYFQNGGASAPSADGFLSSTSFGPPRGSYGISIADLNQDGAPDVIVAGITENTILTSFNGCALSRPVLHTNANGNGTIERNPDQADYDPGQVVQLTAIPAAGYQFLGWAIDLSGNANPTSITMNTSHTVVATFIPVQRSLTLTITGAGSGSVLKTPNRATYDQGSTVHLAARAAFGSLFTSWSGDVSSPDTAIDVVMDTDKAILATFAVDTTLLPHIVSVTDVPLDQGGRVKLRWTASSLETAGDDPQNLVTQYFIWREIPQAAFNAFAGSDAAGATLLHTQTATRDYFWEFVVSLPASRFAGYSYGAVTSSDSIAAGNPYTAFMVQARNAATTRWWSSPPDSGYSVDNLAPPTPGPFVALFGGSSNAFHWGPSHAADLAGYRIHRGSTRTFEPGPGNLIGAPTDTAFVDHSPLATFYKLAAIDVHGNLSHFVLVTPEGPVGTLASLVAATGAPDHIDLTWFVSETSLLAMVYRLELSGIWRPLGTISPDGRGFLTYRDVDVERGQTYTYRLGIEEGGAESFFGETSVLAEDLRFALDGLSPNPTLDGRLRVRFTLPGAGAATVELLDIAGRRLAARTLAGAAGPQSVSLGDEAPIAPGLYWIRLRQSSRETAVRAVVLR